MLSTESVAREAGVAPTTIRRWIHDGILPAQQVGGRYLVAEDDLEDLLKELESLDEDDDDDQDEDDDQGEDDEDEGEDDGCEDENDEEDDE